MKKNFMLIMILLLFSSTGELVQAQKKPLIVVPNIDTTRYAGRWYEIARLPNDFEADCAGDVTTDFTMRSNGKFKVVNSCRKSDGKLKQAKGEAG